YSNGIYHKKMASSNTNTQPAIEALVGSREDIVNLGKKELHTEAKHKILDQYLKAWFPILGSAHGRIIYLDGFAGPGEYEDGEDGSPPIALKAAKDHVLKKHIKSEIIFYFIDKNQRYCEHLERKIQQLDLPQKFKPYVVCGKFDEELTSVLNALEERNSRIAPTFAFVDPFGYSDTPMSVISRFMQHPHCEVFINFMVGAVNRWAPDPQKANSLDRFFGCHEWADVTEIEDTSQRINAYADLYEAQLRDAAEIKYIWRFKMVNRFNQTSYFLFFGTNHKEGLRVMKYAMWSVDVTKGSIFSDRVDPQQSTLFEPKPNLQPLQNTLLEHFSGETVSIEQIEDFVLTKTDYSPDKHLKRPILVPLEKDGLITATNRKKRCIYPKGTIVTFL
ncbi:MAG: three-Cys-motif partner protein TcmP, partial [Methermicoccaceae archaeon]